MISTFQKSPSYNKNQEPKTEPTTAFGLGLTLSIFLTVFCLRAFAMETAKADPPYQGGLMLRIES